MAARGGSLTQFEKDCDDAVLDEVRQAQFGAFGEALLPIWRQRRLKSWQSASF